MAGKRWDGTSNVNISNYKRWSGSSWVSCTGKRWDGTSWVVFTELPYDFEIKTKSGGTVINPIVYIDILSSNTTEYRAYPTGTTWRVTVGSTVVQNWSTNMSNISTGQGSNDSFYVTVESKLPNETTVYDSKIQYVSNTGGTTQM